MSNVISIALAGMAGVLLRYYLSSWIDARSGGAFPWGTVGVNLVGCFLAGCLFQLLVERTVAGAAAVDPRTRDALLIGFLGGFTTFSAYSVQTLTLLRDSQWLSAGLNVGLSNLGGIALAWLGYSLARSL